jgi:hypothetical protein
MLHFFVNLHFFESIFTKHQKNIKMNIEVTNVLLRYYIRNEVNAKDLEYLRFLFKIRQKKINFQ